jgi:hypothetical protein
VAVGRMMRTLKAYALILFLWALIAFEKLENILRRQEAPLSRSAKGRYSWFGE